MKYEFDIVVIGGGAAGLTASKLAHGLGKKVALVERANVGGECTWTGCIPSKTLIHAANVAHLTNTMSEVGLHSSPFLLDTTNVMEHVRSVIKKVYERETEHDLENKGINVFQGSPSFLNSHEITLDDKKIKASKYIIATGSSPFVPSITGIDTVSYLTNETIFNVKTLPMSLIILGGGAIGVEMASALNYLGVQVTILEMQDRLLPKEDHELVERLSTSLKKRGINVITRAQATAVAQAGNQIAVTYQDAQQKNHTQNAEQLLVAVGRKPNVAGLHLEKAGVRVGKKNIEVNEYLQTHAKNIYACGDVVGPYQFSHMAFYQASIATRNAIIPFFKKKVSYENVCWVTFCDPTLGSAGLTEEQARERFGENIKIFRYPYELSDRAITENATEGLAKFIVDKKGYLLGAHILGAQAGQLISEVQVGKTFSLKFKDYFKVIHPYPTYAEIIWHAAKMSYIDTLENNPFLRFLQTLMKWKKN